MVPEELYVRFGLMGYIRNGYGLRGNDPFYIKEKFYKKDREAVKEWLRERNRLIVED